MRGLTELVFSVTNRCTARCQDCPVVCVGDAPRQLTSPVMIELVDEVERWGSLKLVVFTGGEPFLLEDDLRTVVGYVARKGLKSRIVTNAYWATSKREAVRILGELRNLGLTEINFSCDDYHQKFVPLSNVRNANEAALEVGLPALLGHRKKTGGHITVEYLSEYFGVELALFRKGENNPSNNVIMTGPNVPIHSRWDPALDAPSTSDGHSRPWTGGCESVLKSIIISADLRVQICCGIASNSIPELFIGSLAEERLLDILIRGNQDLIANWLALEGPSSILEFVRSVDPAVDLPLSYVNRCHLCNTLFTKSEVRRILRDRACEHQASIFAMRGVLDWISDDWAPAARRQSMRA